MSPRFRNTRTQYGLGGRVLHWISVTLLVMLIVTANKFAGNEDSPDNIDLIMQHASWGVLFLIVMLSRLYWRCINQNPVHSYKIVDWQKFAAIFLHRMIYVVVIVQSIIGLGHLFFSGNDFSFFGFFTLPLFMNSHKLLSDIMGQTHYVISVMIYPLFAIHISAAIYHQLFGEPDHEI